MSGSSSSGGICRRHPRPHGVAAGKINAADEVAHAHHFLVNRLEPLPQAKLALLQQGPQFGRRDHVELESRAAADVRRLAQVVGVARLDRRVSASARAAARPAAATWPGPARPDRTLRSSADSSIPSGCVRSGAPLRLGAINVVFEPRLDQSRSRQSVARRAGYAPAASRPCRCREAAH